MFFTNYVAVDITSSDIRFVSVRRGRISKWATASLPEGIVKSGIIREPQAMSVILDNNFNSLRLNRDRVICTVTGLPFIYRTISMPGGEKIPSEAIERESKREMSLSEEDMYLSWQVTETHKTTKEVDYFVLGVPKTAYNPLMEAFSRAKIKPYMIDIKPLAVARAAHLKDGLIVSLERDYIDVVVVAGGLTRVLHSFSPADKSTEINGLVNEIRDGINRAIKSFEREFPTTRLPVETSIFISGAYSSSDPLLILVQEAVAHPVKMITTSINSPSGMPIGLYATAMGLVAKKFSQTRHTTGYQDINLNLVSGLQRQRPPRFQKAFIIIAAFALILAILVYGSFAMKSRATKAVSSLTQQNEIISRAFSAAQNVNQLALSTKQSANDQNQIAIQQLELITKNNATISSRKIDYAARISGISETLQPGMVAETMDFETKTIQVAGTAQNIVDVLSMISEIEKNPLFLSARVEKLGPGKEAAVTFQIFITNR